MLTLLPVCPPTPILLNFALLLFKQFWNSHPPALISEILLRNQGLSLREYYFLSINLINIIR